MHIIKNNNSIAKINEFGAELKSFTVNGNEIIWQSNPKIWTGSAPVLFPVVGRLKNKKFIHKEKEYFLETHGFARDSMFNLENKTENKITFCLAANSETKKVYPFDFVFRVSFSIENDVLYVDYEVENTGNEKMFFSLGSHPAVNLPLENSALDNYYVEFEKKEFLYRYILNNELLEKQSEPYLDNGNIINLNEHIFDEDALIFKNIKSKYVNVKNDKTGRDIKVNLGAPDIGIWAKPGADYVCIEPWYGYDDMVGSNNLLEDKAGIQSLEPGNTFKTGYSIEVVSN